MKTIHNIGLVWDAYTPAVEGQITRDVIALLSEYSNAKLIFNCPDSSPRMLFMSLGVDLGENPDLCKLWITYQTEAEHVEAPEYAETVIERNLYIAPGEPNLDPNEHPGYYMKPQGRIIAPQLNRQKPPPMHYGPPDPMIILLWG